MNSVIFVRVDEGMQAIQMMQAKLVEPFAAQLRANVVGYSFQVGEISIDKIIDKIHNDTKTEFDSIIIMNKDSISPGIGDVFRFVCDAQGRGIEIYTVSDGNLTKFVSGLVGAAKDVEKIELSNVTTERMKKVASSGKWLGGRTPFGYDKSVDNTLSINDDEAAVVREMFQLYADGISQNTIAHIVADKYGLAHPNGHGRWRQKKISDMLNNTIYNGYPAWGKTSQKNGRSVQLPKEKWTVSDRQIKELVVVDNELWVQVQDRLNRQLKTVN
ncbi:recombinase family protein [Paenibacillus sp. GP183]|uniref:recombinase family protein n=1 Tax=Paenibacillus sp. GP183 TaxID=1882751 RepID=UPI0008971E19|nr:recombinase family protein [Paenibacillus sp. GP183]SEB67366.1 Site-specific DNA recombinase [Paenibacillus sp. GP183]